MTIVTAEWSPRNGEKVSGVSGFWFLVFGFLAPSEFSIFYFPFSIFLEFQISDFRFQIIQISDNFRFQFQSSDNLLLENLKLWSYLESEI